MSCTNFMLLQIYLSIDYNNIKKCSVKQKQKKMQNLKRMINKY